MAITGIFTKRRPNIGGFVFDATLEESDELQTDVTSFAIEDGSIANDHAVTRNQTFSMTVGITDNPIRSLIAQSSQTGALSNIEDLGLPTDLLQSVAGGALGLGVGSVVGALGGSAAAVAGLGGSIASAAYSSGQAATRSEDVLENIRQVQRNKDVFVLTTSKGTYADCIITNTRRRTTPSNEQGLELVVDIMQLRRMSSRRIPRNNIYSEVDALPAQGGDTAATQAQPPRKTGRVTVESIG